MIEDLVRSTLGARAHDVDAVDLSGAAWRGRTPAPPRRVRRRVTLGVIAAVAVAVPVVLVLGSPWTSSSPHPRPAAPPAPAGTQAVSYHGITLDVPTSWPVGTYYCDNPLTSAVTVESGPVPACAPSDRPVRDPRAVVVHLGGYTAVPGADPPSGDVTRVEVDGHAALRVASDRAATDVVPAGREVELFLTDPGVSVAVDAPTDAAADAVLATVSVTPVDDHGCVDHIPAAVVSDNPPAASLLPSAPTSVVVCDYGLADPDGSLWVTGSATLDAAGVTSFARRVSSARPWNPSAQVDAYWGVIAARYVVTFADGSSRVVDSRPDHDQLRVSDGQHDVAITYSDGAGLPGAYSR